VTAIRPRTKLVNRGEEFSAPRATLKRASEARPPEPLKGKSCLIIATQGLYQPLYHDVEDPRTIPKIHLFHFDGYVESPFDTPAVNVEKYLAEKKQHHERKMAKGPVAGMEIVGFCEMCKTRVPTGLDEPRATPRHQARLARLDWRALDALAESFQGEIQGVPLTH
jgi:hypothetical protein